MEKQFKDMTKAEYYSLVSEPLSNYAIFLRDRYDIFKERCELKKLDRWEAFIIYGKK